jgi:hypothetical protein
MNTQQSFAKSYSDYNKYLRWNEHDKLGHYVSGLIYDDFREQIKNAKGVKIVDVRELRMMYDEKKGVAHVDVEIDYYHPESLQVRTVEDTQKWIYTEKDGVWRLVTLLPEFR